MNISHYCDIAHENTMAAYWRYCLTRDSGMTESSKFALEQFYGHLHAAEVFRLEYFHQT